MRVMSLFLIFQVASFRLPHTEKSTTNKIDLEIKTLFTRGMKALQLKENEANFGKRKPCPPPPPKCPPQKKPPPRCPPEKCPPPKCPTEEPKKKCASPIPLKATNKIGLKLSECEDAEGKCKKFPFPTPPRIEYKREKSRCRKKKKRRIKDCPPDRSGKCGKKCESITLSYVLKNDKKDEKKQKCPKLNIGVCEDLPPDKCEKNRKGKTQQCPQDLTKKKKKYKPKKGASPIIEYSVDRFNPNIIDSKIHFYQQKAM